MIRHRSFTNSGALSDFLASKVPSDVYYSSAYYEHPEDPMEKKGWLGADLVFDIDADHIPTPCNKLHDTWVCYKCDFRGKGPSPSQCPNCGEAKYEIKSWMCEDCLESAKNEMIKLVNMLVYDFGFENDEVKAYFSGHRGYHVHVEKKNIHSLDSMTRKEIVDFIIGLGLKVELHGSRVTNGLYKFLMKAPPNKIETVGLDKRTIESFAKNKDSLLESLRNRKWMSIKVMGVRNWKKAIQWIVDQQSAKIDTVVTTDTHRLIRLGGSLHGKTGLMKAEVLLGNLSDFDPLKEAVVFKEGEITINISETPQFRIGDTSYGPFKHVQHKELPTAAALFLLCKGAAQVSE
ncbi:MAG: DNA primase small subunit PriS [Candidatus Bathyarchaeota archaeon]|nr:MAG: DNA primase small subunit PriS [Candidatus Bathyarchaeota archaeon]